MKKLLLILLLVSTYCNGNTAELAEEIKELRTRLEKVENRWILHDAKQDDPSVIKMVSKGLLATISTSAFCSTAADAITKRDPIPLVASIIFLGAAYWLGKSVYDDYQTKKKCRIIFDKLR